MSNWDLGSGDSPAPTGGQWSGDDWGESSGGSRPPQEWWDTGGNRGPQPGPAVDAGPPAVKQPPWALLGAAVVVLAVSVGVAFLNLGIPGAVIGYALAGPVAIGIWAAYLLVDGRRRSD